MDITKLFTQPRHHTKEQDGDANLMFLAYNQKTGEVITIELDQLKQLLKD